MVVMRSDTFRHRDMRMRMAGVNSGRVVMLPAGSWASPDAMIDAALRILEKTKG